MAVGLVQALLMVGGPLAVTAWLLRRWRRSWGIWGAGAAGFLASQLVHLPLLWLVPMPGGLGAQCVVLGLLAGVCEEPARYLVLSRWLRRAERYEEGVIAGLGHGGIESIALGLLVLLGLLGAMALPPDAPASSRLVATATLEAPIWLRLVAVGERACAITFHIAMSLLVLRAARARSLWLLAAAVSLHALFDGLAVAALKLHGIAGAEIIAAAGALLSGFAILHVTRAQRRAREAARDVVDHADEPRRDCAISMRALTKEFDGRVAVDAVTLDSQAGRVIALLGPNGAGKTTTVRMLCALIPPTRGTASVAGQLLVSGADALRAHVGILTETPGLYERLTAHENLDLFARLYGLDAATRAARIEQHLRAFDLWERRDERVAGFSKGMKQKLAIVRALIHEPDVVFLDEPTSGLDPVASREVQDMVSRLKAQGRTILLTTHRLAEAEALADLVAIVQSKLLAFDSFANLKQKMFGLQVKVGLASPISIDGLTGFEKASWQDGQLLIPVGDGKRDTPKLVRALVERGADIVSVNEVGHSLEEIYLGLVKRS